MTEGDAKQITVLIAGRPYPLKIKSGDEPTIRRIVKEVNEKVNKYQLAYPNRDKQDCLAMAALSLAVDSLADRRETTLEKELSEKLSLLSDSIDQLLR